MKSYKLVMTERVTREFNVQANSQEEALQFSAKIASAITDAQDKAEDHPQSVRGRFFDVVAFEFDEGSEPSLDFGTLTPDPEDT